MVDEVVVLGVVFMDTMPDVMYIDGVYQAVNGEKLCTSVSFDRIPVGKYATWTPEGRHDGSLYYS